MFVWKPIASEILNWCFHFSEIFLNCSGISAYFKNRAVCVSISFLSVYFRVSTRSKFTKSQQHQQSFLCVQNKYRPKQFFILYLFVVLTI